jgi:hypothetical protein
MLTSHTLTCIMLCVNIVFAPYTNLHGASPQLSSASATVVLLLLLHHTHIVVVAVAAVVVAAVVGAPHSAVS